MYNFKKMWHLQSCDQKLLSQQSKDSQFFFLGNKKITFLS